MAHSILASIKKIKSRIGNNPTVKKIGNEVTKHAATVANKIDSGARTARRNKILPKGKSPFTNGRGTKRVSHEISKNGKHIAKIAGVSSGIAGAIGTAGAVTLNPHLIAAGSVASGLGKAAVATSIARAARQHKIKQKIDSRAEKRPHHVREENMKSFRDFVIEIQDLDDHGIDLIESSALRSRVIGKLSGSLEQTGVEHDKWHSALPKKEQNAERPRYRGGKVFNIAKKWKDFTPSEQRRIHNHAAAGSAAEVDSLKHFKTHPQTGEKEYHAKHMERAAEHVHKEWIRRNRADPNINPETLKSYKDLPEHEKEKDRVKVRRALEVHNETVRGNRALRVVKKGGVYEEIAT